jgi:hypothetical protein
MPSLQRAAGSGQRAAGSGQRAAGSGQRAAGSGQRAAGSGQRAGNTKFTLPAWQELNAPFTLAPASVCSWPES